MSEHALVWEFDRGSVNCRAICNAAPDADCRLSCYSDCETFAVINRLTDQAFDGEMVSRITHDDCDAGMRADECNVCLFLNESDCIQEMAVGGYPNGPRFIIGTVPIRPSWEGDCYEWAPLAQIDWKALAEAAEQALIDSRTERNWRADLGRDEALDRAEKAEAEVKRLRDGIEVLIHESEALSDVNDEGRLARVRRRHISAMRDVLDAS